MTTLARRLSDLIRRPKAPKADDQTSRHERQAERDAKARRELARAAGVALMGMSSGIEEGLGIRRGAGGVTMALVALAARSRRLLQSAYRLIDAGDRDTAAPLFRVMSEYLIVGRWALAVGEEELKDWALDDLRARLTLLRETAADPELGEMKPTLEQEIQSTEEAIRHHGGAGSPVTRSAARKAGYERPTIEAMAKKANLGFAYGYAYRLLSQADVHATPVAIDSILAQTDEGVAVTPVPRFALEGYDSYLVGAHLLLDILRPLAERIPELGWERTAELVSETLVAISRADPDSSRS